MNPSPFIETPARPAPLPKYSPESNAEGRGDSVVAYGDVIAPGEVIVNGKVVKGWVHVNPRGQVTIKPNAHQIDPETGKDYEPREYVLGDLNNAQSAAQIRASVRTMSMKANRMLQANSTNGGRDFRDPNAERKVPENRRSHGHASTVQMRGGYHKELEPADKGHAYTFNVKLNDETSPGSAPGATGAFSGYVYVGGVKKSVTGTADTYVRVYFDGSDPIYTSDGSCTKDYEAYEVAKTFGDIHETRA